jgi:hypothetical protein
MPASPSAMPRHDLYAVAVCLLIAPGNLATVDPD